MRFWTTLSLIVVSFLAFTLPLAFERPAGGRSAERQAYTAGIIRMYCLQPEHSVIAGPQIHFGNNPFNLEFTGLEWAQGVVAKTLKPNCEWVEPVAKIFSVACSALGIIAVALLTLHLWGALAGIISAVILSTDELWLRYSTFTMIENRCLAFGVLAILFSLRRRPVLAALFWTFTLVQKPQIFIFTVVFWALLEIFFQDYKKAVKKITPSLLVAGLIGVVWFGWSHVLDQQSDLPWIIHTGPRAKKWYFGNWADRFTLSYVKHTLLGWFRDSGLNVTLPMMALIGPSAGRIKGVRELFRRATPFLGATVVYTFLTYSVFLAHEYYALPLNIARAVTMAALLSLLLRTYLPSKSKVWPKLAMVITVAALGLHAFLGLRAYIKFAMNINNPNTITYYKDWNVDVFPRRNKFVVMAGPGTGRDLLYLYVAKQHGFVWCTKNEKYAPRKFWKEQGVEYVAWATHIDPKTGVQQWKVRSIEEELVLARKNGWASEVNDPWATHSMAEWAALASRSGHDPCGSPSEFDPRTWK